MKTELREDIKIPRTGQFGQLRARIEATFATPAMLVVSSAARGDGKTLTAFGLADALAQAYHRVLLVDTNVDAPTLARIHHVPVGPNVHPSDVSRCALPVAAQRFDGISLADGRFEVGMSMDAVRAAVADMRHNFDYIVVDTSPLIRSDLAVLFATIADGTLLTLRMGRLPSPADEATVMTLKRVGATVLGVLTLTPELIKNFDRKREEVVPTVRVPARHVTSHHAIAPEVVRGVAEPARPTVRYESNVLK
jgi:Mrp family chromosome partitioning ATPase